MKLFTGSIENLFELALKKNGFQSGRYPHRSCHLHYWHTGLDQDKSSPKPLIVVVHGIGSCSSHFTELMIRLRKQGYPILALDLPCHGKSHDPSNEPMTGDLLFQIFQDFMHDMIEPDRKFVLFGNSLGGGLTIKYAVDSPRKPSHLIAVSPVGGFQTQAEWESFRSDLQFKNVSDARKFLLRVYRKAPWYLSLFAPSFLKAMTRKGVLELVNHASIEDFQLKHLTDSYNVPTLLIWGKAEKVFPASHLIRFKSFTSSNVLIEEPESVGHCPHLDSPKWLVQRVIDFIK